MAKSRMINTRFWNDPFVQNLCSSSKLLFLYLLSNEHTNIAGFYELSERTILFETGFTKEEFLKAMDSLSEKVQRIDNWIYIKNFVKHQQRNPKVSVGISREIDEIPLNIREMVIDKDSLSIDYDTLSYLTKLNLTKLNLMRERTDFENPENPTPANLEKRKVGKFVLLSKDEYDELKDLMGDSLSDYINRLDDHIGSKGVKYESHFYTIKKWFNQDSK